MQLVVASRSKYYKKVNSFCNLQAQQEGYSYDVPPVQLNPSKPPPPGPTTPAPRPPPPPPQPEGGGDSKPQAQESGHGHGHSSDDPLAWLRESVPGKYLVPVTADE